MTDHSTRSDRDLKNRFWTRAYAQEELRAEPASMFIGSKFGLPFDITNCSSYIVSWLKALKKRKKQIFRTASDAQKAADLVLGFHPEFARQVEVVSVPSTTTATDVLARPVPQVALRASSC